MAYFRIRLNESDTLFLRLMPLMSPLKAASWV